MFKKIMKTDNDKAVALMRIFLGAVMFPHGAQKALGWFGGRGLSATIDGFQKNLDIPSVLAHLVIAAEFLGAVGLLVGLLSRVAAFGILSVMLGAVFMVHLQYGFFMNWYGNQQGQGFEYHLLAIALSLGILLKGSGAWSLDRMLRRRAAGLPGL